MAEEEFDPMTNVEVWESTTEGTVWVEIKDPRAPQGYRKIRVGGGGSRTLRITTDDRRFNQERIVEELRGSHDPFTNGFLRFVSSGPKVDDIDPRYHLHDSDLLELLAVKDMDLFEQAVREITSEVVIRRLRAVAEKEATVGQLDVIDAIVEERYKVGGTQRAVREMMEEGERVGGQVLSDI